MTVLTHNTYSRHQCEREISNKLKASIKARKTETTTTTVNDIIENEDTYSAPQLENYIDGRVNQAVKKATNPWKSQQQKRKGTNSPSSTFKNKRNNNNTGSDNSTTVTNPYNKASNSTNRVLNFQPPPRTTTNQNTNNTNTNANNSHRRNGNFQ